VGCLSEVESLTIGRDRDPNVSMTRPIKTVPFDLRGNVWSYEDVIATPGAFRMISVAALLGSARAIHLHERNDLDWTNANGAYPKYAAISHVWDPSKAVRDACNANPEPINIAIKSDKEWHEIHWHGLVDAARAAERLKCEYLWLDLLCIDQVDRNETGDKKKQIQIMGKIYERAEAVIVMVGGVGAVQGVDAASAWIDRAWTLQEASLCENTYVLVNWPYQKKFTAARLFRDDPDNEDEDKLYEIEFMEVTRGKDLALIPLENLLELELLRPSITFPKGFDVHCFESSLVKGPDVDRRKLNAARLALLAVLRAGKTGNEELKQGGAWKCMLLRISERRQDMIFSIMHLLGVEIEVNYKRTPESLYVEMVEKVAVRGYPAWLGVGSINGDIIPRNPQSGLCPEIPTYKGRELPKYKIQHKMFAVSEVISRSADYISNFDIDFTNELVCCRVLRLRMTSLYAVDETQLDLHHSFLTSSDSQLEGTCIYRWNPGVAWHATTEIYVVVIGQTALFGRHHQTARDSGHSRWYVYLVRKIGVAWTRVGAGIWIVTRGSIPSPRTHLIFGARKESPWSNCDCDPPSTIEESNEVDELFTPINREIGGDAYTAHVQEKVAEMQGRFERINRTMEETRKVVVEGKRRLADSSRRKGEERSDGRDETRLKKYYNGMGPSSTSNEARHARQTCQSGTCEHCHPIKRRM